MAVSPGFATGLFSIRSTRPVAGAYIVSTTSPRAQLMMFDEPTANLAPNLAEEVLERLIGMKEQFGITVIFVEQNAAMVLDVCDKVYLLANGRVNYTGDAKELLDNPRF